LGFDGATGGGWHHESVLDRGTDVFFVIEKLVKHGDKISYVAGVLMAGTGTYLLVSA
jgi:hypothetical protein